jgi:hypothetical protein
MIPATPGIGGNVNIFGNVEITVNRGFGIFFRGKRGQETIAGAPETLRLDHQPIRNMDSSWLNPFETTQMIEGRSS